MKVYLGERCADLPPYVTVEAPGGRYYLQNRPCQSEDDHGIYDWGGGPHRPARALARALLEDALALRFAPEWFVGEFMMAVVVQLPRPAFKLTDYRVVMLATDLLLAHNDNGSKQEEDDDEE